MMDEQGDRTVGKELTELREAALALYNSGFWISDRLDRGESAQVWEALRDALKLPVGTSPKKI